MGVGMLQLVGHQRNQGYSLIEILVSIVVISVGLLGMATLQTRGIRFSQDAYLRSIASSQAYEMLDRMRANPDGVSNGSYDFSGGMPSSAPSCAASTCSSNDSALRDGFQWNQNIAALLPSGQGAISLAGGNYTITISWDRRITDTSGAVCGPDPDTDLTCFSVNLVQ
jgi:type IV pilus assembly protein PilV